MTSNKKTLGYIFLGIYSVFLIIFLVLALLPGESSASQSSFITDIVMKVIHFISFNKWNPDYETTHIVVRKLFGHFSYCAVMGVFLIIWIKCLITKEKLLKIGKIHLITSLIISAIVALTSELLQLIPVGRGCSIVDIGIDFAGHIMGISIVYIIILINARPNKIKKKE